MRNEKRAAILGQLREIHDGMFVRSFGTGETKIWKGRVSILAAVTPALDRHYSVFTTLGERFLQLRWHRPSSEQAGEWAIEQQGREDEIHTQLTKAVRDLFNQSSKTAPVLPTPFLKRLAAVSELIAFGRTYVGRASYGTREIDYVPEPEANTRISKGLAAIAKGIAALYGRAEVAEADVQDTFRVALDCLPESRRAIFCAAIRGEDSTSRKLHHSVRSRTLEDLAVLGILDSPTLTFSDRATELLSAAQLTLPI